MPENENTQIVTSTLAVAYNGLGLQHIDQAEYQEAIDVFTKALTLPENENTPTVKSNIAIAYSNLGVQYLAQQLYQEAIVTSKKALGYQDIAHKHVICSINTLYCSYVAEYNTSKDPKVLKDAISYLSKVETLRPLHILQYLTDIHKLLAQDATDTIDLTIIHNVFAKCSADNPYAPSFKEILANYHLSYGKQLAKALVGSCAPGKYEKVMQHVAILKNAVCDVSCSTQISNLYFSMAKHSGDLKYLEQIDAGSISQEDQVEINQLKSAVYSTLAQKAKAAGDLSLALQYIEECKKVEGLSDASSTTKALEIELHLALATQLQSSKPQEALDHCKKAYDIDKASITGDATKKLISDICINLAKECIAVDRMDTLEEAIKSLTKASKAQDTPEVHKLKIDVYLKLQEFDKAILELKFLQVQNPNPQQAADINLYTTKVCVRLIRNAQADSVDPDSALQHINSARTLLQTIVDGCIREALEYIIKDRHYQACYSINKLLSNPALDECIIEEILSLIPKSTMNAFKAQDSSSERMTEACAKSAESLEHENFQINKRVNIEAQKREHGPDQGQLTWKIKDVTYKWEGYTKFEELKYGAHQITPNLFAIIDPALSLGEYETKFQKALDHGMATAAHGEKGIKVIGEGRDKGYELKIIGKNGSGDARLVSSKIYTCAKPKQQAAAPEETQAAQSSPKKPTTPPKQTKTGTKTSPDPEGTEDQHAIKFILFDILTDHNGVERGEGTNPEYVEMQLGGEGWE